MKFSNKNHSPSCVSFSINGYTMSVKTPFERNEDIVSS
jgi:hypothetical protein